MLYKNNWEDTQRRFNLWWKGENKGRPLMSIVGLKPEAYLPLPDELRPKTPEDQHLNVDQKVARFRHQCQSREFYGESFPNISLDIGPGSMAAYLGATPQFSKDTVWYTECVEDWNKIGKLEFNPNDIWWKKHLDMFTRARELVGDDFLLGIPDIIENLDILSAMRGAQNMIFDIMDEPEMVQRRIEEIDDLYFKYYDPMYDLTKMKDGSCCYTVFQIWGPGRTAKIQCDFSAMISPDQFREFVQPSLRKQCQALDFSLYHLDGPDAIRHVEAVMEIEELNALQWTCGAGQPDGTSERWYPIYDQVVKAGKSLWIQIYDGDVDEWIVNVDRLMNRYGTSGMFLLFPEMEQKAAEKLMNHAEKHWD